MTKPKPERFINSKNFEQALITFEEEFPRFPIVYPVIRFFLSIAASLCGDMPFSKMQSMTDEELKDFCDKRKEDLE